MTDIYASLAEIVGKDRISTQKEERYFYGRDLGLAPAHEPEYVVTPKTTEEVQQIVKLANQEKIPVVPMGAGMSLVGLTIPLKGGIVIDLKRMKRILEVNEKARHVVVEAGTSHGVLKAYLEKHYPHLVHSLPESPPATTIAGNVMLQGQGHLIQQYGLNSEMVTGLEVILPTGDICKIGSCSVSPYWFSRGPTLPDLSGLFLGWFGTTGIITKVGMKLYPKKKMRDVEVFLTDKADLVPEIGFRLTHTEMVQNILALQQQDPVMFKGHHLVATYITGDTDEEIEFKRKMVWDSLKEFRASKDGGFMTMFPPLRSGLLEMPQTVITTSADYKKGGGFQYIGPTVLTEKYAVLTKKLEELADKYKLSYFSLSRFIDGGHAMMFGMAFPFNRADSDMMDRARKALREGSTFAFEHGGMPWKATVYEQEMVMERMDPVTLKLMKMIRDNLDPNKIMNPGNWEVK
jgi:glycolate oxidase